MFQLLIILIISACGLEYTPAAERKPNVTTVDNEVEKSVEVSPLWMNTWVMVDKGKQVSVLVNRITFAGDLQLVIDGKFCKRNFTIIYPERGFYELDCKVDTHHWLIKSMVIYFGSWIRYGCRRHSASSDIRRSFYRCTNYYSEHRLPPDDTDDASK